MSFLKRLFSGGSERQRATRAPRVRVSPLHRVAFRPKADRDTPLISLGNISTQGMGLIRRETDPKLGKQLKGTLEINSRTYDLSAEVRHETESVLGCAFTGSFESVSQAVEDYFRVEICALKLHKVDEAYLKKDPEGRVTWFTDGRQNEVYVVADDAGIANFHLSFLGNYIEGGRGKVLRAGHIIADERHKYQGADLLELSSEISDEILRLGQSLVENVEGLPKEQVEIVRALLSKK